MNRHIFSPLLLLTLAVATAAQTPAPPDAPPGVSVLKYNWRNASYRPGWDSSGLSADNRSLEDPRTMPAHDLGVSRVPNPIGSNTPGRPRERATEGRAPGPTEGRTAEVTASGPTGPRGRKEEYAYEIQIRNGGEAAIEAVDWEYVFLDSLTGLVMARHRFQSFRRAKPGKSLTLTGTSVAPPTRVVNAAAQSAKEKPFEERIVVRCVAYSDGTVRWRAGRAEDDCSDIREAVARRARRP